MKATELRLGNVLNNNGKICQLIGMTWIGGDEDVSTNHDLVFNNGDYEVSLRQVSPIPLTEQILLNVGFVSDELNGSFETFENGLKFTIIDKCGAWMIYLSGPFGMIILKHVKYIHELQNLFNSLTGQELNTVGLINTKK
jgi:hypothetical protein